MKFSASSIAALVLLPMFGGLTPVSIAGTTLEWGDDGLGTYGSWTVAGVNWWDGAQAVAWIDGADAVFQGSGGNVSSSTIGPTVSALTFSTPGYKLVNGSINGGSSGLIVKTVADATISSSLIDNNYSDGFGMTKTGTGVLTVSGVNSYSDVHIVEGEYVASFTTASQSFRVDAGATLTFAPSSSPTSVASISGSGLVHPDAQARNLSVAFSGISDFSGQLTDNGSGILWAQFLLSSEGRLLSAATYSGGTVVASGTLVLASNGAITASSGLSISSGATLRLDNLSAGASSHRLHDALPVDIRGGTLEIRGGAGAGPEMAGALKTLGAGRILLSSSEGTLAPAIQFSSFQRQQGSTLEISGNGDVSVAGVSNGATGIVSPAITRNREWVTADADGMLSPFTAYVTDFGGATETSQVKVTDAGTLQVPGSVTIGSLNMVSSPPASSQQLVVGTELKVASGGILSSGAGRNSIVGGTLTTDGELLVTNTNDLTILSPLQEGSSPMSLTKSGPGTLILGSGNSFTGVTSINEGILRIGSAGALGATSSVVFSGGTLQASADFTLSRNLVGSNGNSVRIDTGSHAVTLNGGFTGSLVKTGDGSLTFVPSYISNATVAQGTLLAPNPFAGNVTLSEGARLEAAGTLSSILIQGPSTLGIGLGDDAATLTLGSLTRTGLSGPLTVEFGLGSGQRDLLVINSPFFLTSPTVPTILFEFIDLGGLQIGTDYQIISSRFLISNSPTWKLALAPEMIEAGWRATFTAGSSGVFVNLATVPEPAPIALLVLGMGGVLTAVLRRRHP